MATSKKKPKKAPVAKKKIVTKKAKPKMKEEPISFTVPKKKTQSKKILTAEGWKRLMLRKGRKTSTAEKA